MISQNAYSQGIYYSEKLSCVYRRKTKRSRRFLSRNSLKRPAKLQLRHPPPSALRTCQSRYTTVCTYSASAATNATCFGTLEELWAFHICKRWHCLGNIYAYSTNVLPPAFVTVVVVFTDAAFHVISTQRKHSHPDERAHYLSLRCSPDLKGGCLMKYR